MRIAGWLSFVFVAVVGCATGAESTSQDGGVISVDGGRDTGGSADTGYGGKDTGTTKDSGGTEDTGGPPCGSGCLGTASTCCNNACVDITSDQNNCGGCGTPCGAQSCCSGNCINTMGSDAANCGGCGVVCSGTCNNGTCVTTTGCTYDKGTCSHSPCVAGSALSPGCDPDGVVAAECLYLDPTCCSSSWSSLCVSDATGFWGEACTGTGC